MSALANDWRLEREPFKLVDLVLHALHLAAIDARVSSVFQLQVGAPHDN
jgi:hypothetical protein